MLTTCIIPHCEFYYFRFFAFVDRNKSLLVYFLTVFPVSQYTSSGCVIFWQSYFLWVSARLFLLCTFRQYFVQLFWSIFWQYFLWVSATLIVVYFQTVFCTTLLNYFLTIFPVSQSNLSSCVFSDSIFARSISFPDVISIHFICSCYSVDFSLQHFWTI